MLFLLTVKLLLGKETMGRRFSVGRCPGEVGSWLHMVPSSYLFGQAHVLLFGPAEFLSCHLASFLILTGFPLGIFEVSVAVCYLLLGIALPSRCGFLPCFGPSIIKNIIFSQ